MEWWADLSFWKDLLLAAIQGVAEIFPVSSSGHLFLFSGIFGSQLSFQEILFFHLGTFGAIWVFFFRDVINLLKGQNGWRLTWGIGVAFLTSALTGFILRYLVFSDVVRSPEIVAPLLALNGVLIGSFVKISRQGAKKLTELGLQNFSALGAIQRLAAIPGISRLGMTLGLGLFFGLSWREALKFSFLLSLPTIFFANLFEAAAQTTHIAGLQMGILDLHNPIPILFQSISTTSGLFLIVSFVAALIALNFLLKQLNRPLLLYFGIYCFVAGPFYRLFFQLL